MKKVSKLMVAAALSGFSFAASAWWGAPGYYQPYYGPQGYGAPHGAYGSPVDPRQWQEFADQRRQAMEGQRAAMEKRMEERRAHMDSMMPQRPFPGGMVPFDRPMGPDMGQRDAYREQMRQQSEQVRDEMAKQAEARRSAVEQQRAHMDSMMPQRPFSGGTAPFEHPGMPDMEKIDAYREQMHQQSVQLRDEMAKQAEERRNTAEQQRDEMRKQTPRPAM